jgi:hypothetical protein
MVILICMWLGDLLPKCLTIVNIPPIFDRSSAVNRPKASSTTCGARRFSCQNVLMYASPNEVRLGVQPRSYGHYLPCMQGRGQDTNHLTGRGLLCVYKSRFIIINSCIQALFGPRFGSMRANLGTIG